MLRDQLEPSTLDLADVLDVAYSYLVDGVDAFVDSQAVRQRVDVALQTTWLDRETWGTDAATLDAIPAAKPVRTFG